MKNRKETLNHPPSPKASDQAGVQNDTNIKYYLWILGCAMNYSDAERISAVLDSLGYKKTENEKEADIFITIACSVRQSAINRIYGKVRDLKDYKSINPNFKTILSGCVLEADRKKLKKVFDIMFEIKDLEMLPKLLVYSSSEVIQNQGANNSRLRSNNNTLPNEYLEVTPHYNSTFRAYVPISTGCNNFCTYCAVPYTRGREKSRPADEIITEVKELIKNGYKEITLLGQNVNSYGNDLTPTVIPAEMGIQEKLGSGSLGLPARPEDRSGGRSGMTRNVSNNKFIQLLLEIDKIPGDFRIYFYSNHPKNFTDELIYCLQNLQHFPHYIHLPLQSGNDEIIKIMNRHYTKEKYLRLVEKIRIAMPDVTLTTDIIVGFPTETIEQFTDTVEVMEKAKYDMAFIAQYSPRKGTVASKMLDDITKEEKRRREDILQKILSESADEHNKKLVGTIQKVLIDAEKDGIFYGRTEGYKVVEIQNYSSSVAKQKREVNSSRLSSNNKTDQAMKLGQFVDVKIKKATAWKLSGDLV